MKKNTLTSLFSLRRTPQSEPIPGTSQVRNDAGGYVYAIDDFAVLERFLILGSEGGTYYVSPRTLTRRNAEAVCRCIAADGLRVVETIVDVSTNARAPKQGPAIFALALALKIGDLETRRAARAAVPRVCRTGTQLFQLAEAVKAMGGWGRVTKGAFADWYADKAVGQLTYQAIKYQQRDGWSHRDLLRKTHVRTDEVERAALYRWMVTGELVDGASERLRAVEELKSVSTAAEAIRLIGEHDLPREVVPTRFLHEATVWDALLTAGRGMPTTALLRNLAKMSAVGLLTPGSEAEATVLGRLDGRALRRARVHPLAVLVALTTYQAGRGVRGKLTWQPTRRIVDALDAAFYASFDNVATTGLRWMLALDVSGSMGWGDIAGLPGITPRVASAAMALITAATEPQSWFVGFTSKLSELNISTRQRLDDVVKTIDGLPFGATDCAQPMLHATKRRQQVDVFVVYTDNETWHGKVHPRQALEEYRQRSGRPARLVVVGMTATGFSIADPDDVGMLDVVGFDTSAPALISRYALGEL